MGTGGGPAGRRLPVAARIRRMLRGWRASGRAIRIRREDRLIVSYPRSGNTWVRFLVGNLLDPGSPTDFVNVERRVPDIYLHGDTALSELGDPRFLKSHEPVDPRYRRVVYLVRDPLDVAVSFYHFQRKRRLEAGPIDAFVQRYLDGEVDNYGSWGRHVGGWLGARSGDPDFLVVRYEDLVGDTEAELRRIADLFEIPAPPAAVRGAVAAASARRMRVLERDQSDRWRTTAGSRRDIPFVRTAGPGAGAEELPRGCAEQIERAWGTTMRQLGYR